MTEVWWCAVDGTEHDYSCQYFHEGKVAEPPHESCGLRRLVPVDALILVRDADGKWPVDRLRLIETVILNTLGFVQAEDILDALAEAIKENPQ